VIQIEVSLMLNHISYLFWPSGFRVMRADR